MSGLAPLSGTVFESLRVERRADLLWVTLDDPERANALSPVMMAELQQVYAWDWRRDGIRALLLAGAGKNFCGGADLDHLRRLRDASPQENLADSQRMRRLFEAVLRQETLTVALVQGSCVAGGCGLATACDFVVAAENARFLYSEARIGFVAALVATFLPLRVRGRDLRELLLDPDFIDAARALEVGLINRVVPADRLREDAEAVTAAVLDRASGESIARTKRLLLQSIGRPLEEAFELAAQANAEARATDDCRRGIDSFLATKKPPRWRS